MLNIGEFVKGIRIPMCQKRCDVLIQVFYQMDINRDEKICINDLKIWFKLKGYSFSRNLYVEENVNETVFTLFLNYKLSKL